MADNPLLDGSGADKHADGGLPCPLFKNNSNWGGGAYQDVIVNIRLIVSVISFVGSLFVIALIWLFKKYKFFTQRLILYLSVAALLSSTAYILGRIQYDPHNSYTVSFCTFSGFWLLYTDWVLLLSTIGITVNLLLKVSSSVKSDRFEVGYVLFSFLPPFLIVWIPFVSHSYGPSGAWCWIRSKNDSCTDLPYAKMLQYALWYGPLYALIGLLFLMYLFIIASAKLQSKKWQGMYDPVSQQRMTLLRNEVRPLLWYPCVYLIVSVFPFINRLVYNADEAYLSLYILHVSTAPLTGALVALMFGLDKETLRRLTWQSIKGSGSRLSPASIS